MNLAAIIRAGLAGNPKSLPSALFYDALGSQLFEAITLLPEYALSRTGMRMLRENAGEMVGLPGELEIVELGPGAGAKARILVEALRKRQAKVRFTGVDVSDEALVACRRTLEEVEGVSAVGIQASYIEGLRLALLQRKPGARVLVPFLGSNISNFARADARRFLGDVRQELGPGDVLLLAADLEKPPARLLPAYDDALGVTAAFNKNALLRLNAEWGADFDLAAFAHEARWNADERRVEMHLRALRPQEVHVRALELRVSLREGETIWTESSHRFSLEELRDWASGSGYLWRQAWVDEEWPYVQCLLEVPPPD